MKKKFILFTSFTCALFYAQQGKVGINTDTPSATLDIVSKANTSDTKALKISNSSATEMFTVRDDGQVGINQATPATDALLELNSPNKSLLLTRVTNATDVATPVNGMLVYDITLKCIRGYENDAWSGCLSAGGSSSGVSAAFSWQTNLRFKQFTNVQFNGSNFLEAGGVTTDGKVFFWGRDYFGSINLDSKLKQSPVYMDGTGKWGNGNAVKIQLGNDAYYVLDSNGAIWSWGSQESGQLGDGVNGGNVTVRRTFANAATVIKPTGVIKFLDMAMRYRTLVVLGDNGKVYYYGRSEGTGSANATAAQMPFPSGVTSYTKIWQGNERASGSLYMLGNDGNLYSTGTLATTSGNSTVAAATSATTFGVNITKVNLPAGEAAKLVKVDTDWQTAFGLTSEGKIYTWGKVKFDYGAGADPNYYGTIYQCLLNDNTGVTTIYNGSQRTYYAYDPVLIKLPTGETSFTDVTAADTTNQFLCSSGKSYVMGVQSYTNEAGALGTYSDNYKSYQDYQFVYALEYVANVKQINSAGYSTLALDADGKLWGYGDNRYCMSGAGYLCPQDISTALPLMNGNLDPNNPRPQTVN